MNTNSQANKIIITEKHDENIIVNNNILKHYNDVISHILNFKLNKTRILKCKKLFMLKLILKDS